jgi:hypothetical protein
MTDDEKLLRVMAGATFGPQARLVLPSGRELTSDEANWEISLHPPRAHDCHDAMSDPCPCQWDAEGR